MGQYWIVFVPLRNIPGRIESSVLVSVRSRMRHLKMNFYAEAKKYKREKLVHTLSIFSALALKKFPLFLLIERERILLFAWNEPRMATARDEGKMSRFRLEEKTL